MQSKKIKKIWIAEDNPSIQRTKEKCLNCGQCQKTCWEKTGLKFDKAKLKEPVCLNCGQCILTCPTGALTPKYEYKKILDLIHDTNKTVIISAAPATRVAIGDEFKYEPGAFLEGKMVAALKKIGFSYVFDVTFGADLTIIEEANELVNRLKNKLVLPQLTSCCPAWVKYVEIFHPELIPNLATSKSPIAMQAAIIRTYFRRLKDIDPNEIINVVVVPCTAKKYEIKRSEIQGVDYAITTSELAMMIRESEIDFRDLSDENFDCLLSKGSASGLLFGISGGVMEATLRTAYALLTNKKAPAEILSSEFLKEPIGFKEATVKIGDYDVKIAIINGLINLSELLPKINQYDFIEVMNCSGGCIGGGGQPLASKNPNLISERLNNLYNNCQNMETQVSYNNPDIQNVYRCFLGEPHNDLSQSLLHTTYRPQEEAWKKGKRG